MRRIRSFAVVAAATSAITFAGVGTATADTTATNGGLASATFLSYGDVITVTHYNYDPDMPWPESWAEWYTDYGREDSCGPTRGSITCRPNVAENRYIYIRVCTDASLINPPTCGAYKRSSTS